MTAWFAAFVWTLVVEGFALEFALGRFARRVWEPLSWCLLLNLATHPLFSWWATTQQPGPGEVAVAEVAIAAIEGLALGLVLRSRAGFARPALAAALANAASYAFGLWVLAPLCA